MADRVAGAREVPVFLQACRRQEVRYTPVWLMRQAGRYMAEYRAMREKFSFLDLCRTPAAAADVTITAATRLGVDAAIIFADILLVIEPLDVGLEFGRAEGPVIRSPVRTPAQIESLRTYDTADRLAFVCEAIRQTKLGLPPSIPLIGFSGAPFTLASYLIEGGGSRTFAQTKSLMYHHPDAWHRLLELLARLVNSFLKEQVAAGADAVQIFDSWVGCLAPDDYREYVLPHSRTAMAGISALAPLIHFGTGTAGILGAMREAGGDVIGVDWRIDLDAAWNQIGRDVGIQGNLDPLTLLAPPEAIRKRAAAILARAGGQPGHIFNLGHGVLPETPVDHVRALVDGVHELSARR
jgi:uroporphyrinogen decarboxylase